MSSNSETEQEISNTKVSKKRKLDSDEEEDEDANDQPTTSKAAAAATNRSYRRTKKVKPSQQNTIQIATSFHYDSSSRTTINQALAKLINSNQTIEIISCNFQSTSQLTEFLNALHSTKLQLHLKQLTIKFKQPAIESLTEKHLVQLLTKLDLSRLELLELHCGLWEDVESATIEQLFKTTKVLKQFKLTGNFQGDSEWNKVLIVELPQLDELEYFSMGTNYDFLSVYEPIDYEESVQQPRSSSTQPDFVSLTETQLLHTKLKFKNELINLKGLELGNLVQVESMFDFTKTKFPKLTTFKVSSAWNETIDLIETESYQLPSFLTISELQLPDCCRNEKFIQKLYRMFPNIHKIWFNLPTAKCLKRLFFTMHRSKLTELYLKTQYDFSMVLESVFITKPFDVHEELQRTGKDQTLKDVEQLRNPLNCNQIYTDFLHYHHLSLPLTRDEMEKCPYGISSLQKLHVLEFVHVPRLLRIPMSNNIMFTSPNAKFHGKRRIGFMKYELGERLFTEEFPKLKNLRRLKFLGGNFTVKKDVWIKFCKRCHFNNVNDFNETRDGIAAAGEADKLEPSRISRANEFKPKTKNRRDDDDRVNEISLSNSSITTTGTSGTSSSVQLINPYQSLFPVKLEKVKEEKI